MEAARENCARSTVVECSCKRLWCCRAIALRFEREAADSLALVKPASARVWMRFHKPVT